MERCQTEGGGGVQTQNLPRYECTLGRLVGIPPMCKTGIPRGKNRKSVGSPWEHCQPGQCKPDCRTASSILFSSGFMDDEELHRQHFRRTFDVAAYAASAGLLRNDGVPRIDACDSRIGEYLKNHQPCTIQGVDETWSTRTLWTAQALSDMDTIDGGARARMNVQLAQTHTTLAGGVERHKVTLGWFLSEYCAVQCDDVPLYVFDPQPAPLLLKDCCGAAPPFFPDDWHADLADSLLRPNFRWFSIGPCRSGLPWHCDPAMTSAWNYVASGRKLWMLYPPGCTPPALTHEPDGASSVTSYQKPGGALRWILEVLPYLHPHHQPKIHLQHAGETMFVPSGWWHSTLNLETTIGITRNFVCRTSAEAAVHQLRAEANLWHGGGALPSAQLSLAGGLGAHRGFREQRARLRKLWELRSEDRDVLGELGDRLYGLDVWRRRAINAASLWELGVEKSLYVEQHGDDAWPIGSSANVCFCVGECFVKLLTTSRLGKDCALPREITAWKPAPYGRHASWSWGATDVRPLPRAVAQSRMESLIARHLADDLCTTPRTICGALAHDDNASVDLCANDFSNWCGETWQAVVAPIRFVASARIHGATLARCMCNAHHNVGSTAWEDAVAYRIGELLSRLHAIEFHANLFTWPMSGAVDLSQRSDEMLWNHDGCALIAACNSMSVGNVPLAWAPFCAFLRVRRASAALRARLALLPSRLVDEIDMYLPADPAILCLGSSIEQGILPSPSMVHGDAHAENFILPQSGEDPLNAQLIDYGDAGMGDPLYDAIAVGANCIAPHSWDTFARALQPKSCDLPSSLLPTSYRLACYALLHASPAALRLWIRMQVPDAGAAIARCSSMDEFEQLCFATAARAWDEHSVS